MGGHPTAGQQSAGKESGAWIAHGVSALAPNGARPARRGDAKASSVRVVIVSAMFLVLFAATLLVGGRAAIDRLVEAATAPQQDPRGPSSVVYTMPDGIFCRRVSFDNVTAQVTEGPIERCETDSTIARARARPSGAFAWRNNPN